MKERMDPRNIIIGVLASILVMVVLGLSIPLLNDAATTAHLSNRISLLEYALGAAGISPNQVLYADSSGDLAGDSDMIFSTDTLIVTKLNAPTGRGATYIVAASDAPSHIRAQADYLCDGTDDTYEIDAALSAGAGGTIYISGNFTITDDDPISLPSDTILEGMGYLGAHIWCSNSHNGEIVTNSDNVTGNTNITIRNIFVDGNEDNVVWSRGIIFDNVTGGLIENCWVQNCENEGTGDRATTGSGIVVLNSSYITIQNNTVYSVEQDGIALKGNIGHISVLNNYLLENDVEGIQLAKNEDTVGFDTYDVLIQGNHVDGNAVTDDGITTHNGESNYCTEIQIVDNIIEDCGCGIRWYKEGTTYDAKSVIARNTIKNIWYGHAAAYSGIFLKGGCGIDVKDNIIVDVNNTNADGIRLEGASNNRIEGNTVTDCEDNGISLRLTSSNNIVDGNYVYSNQDHGIFGNVADNTTYIRNTVYNNNLSDGGRMGIYVYNSDNCKVYSNIVGRSDDTIGHDDAIITQNQCDATRIIGNDIQDYISEAIDDNGTNSVIYNNWGFTTEASGTATIPNGSTDIAVTHGLDVTPDPEKFHITPLENPTNAITLGVADNCTATHFWIIGDDPGASNCDVGWSYSDYP